MTVQDVCVCVYIYFEGKAHLDKLFAQIVVDPVELGGHRRVRNQTTNTYSGRENGGWNAVFACMKTRSKDTLGWAHPC
jgi:hypothetical protein